jgi:hypothetical protein
MAKSSPGHNTMALAGFDRRTIERSKIPFKLLSDREGKRHRGATAVKGKEVAAWPTTIASVRHPAASL